MADQSRLERAVPYEETLDSVYGLELIDDGSPETVAGRLRVTAAALNDLGVVHGGVFAAVAETLASYGTARSAIPQRRQAMGLSNDTTVVAAVADGLLAFEARVRAEADDAWVWTVEARDEGGGVCAVSRVTIAIR